MSKAQREILIPICVIGAILALIVAACLWYTRPRAFSALLPNGGEGLHAHVTLMSREEDGWDLSSFLLTPEQTRELVDRLSTTQYRADLAGNLFSRLSSSGHLRIDLDPCAWLAFFSSDQAAPVLELTLAGEKIRTSAAGEGSDLYFPAAGRSFQEEVISWLAELDTSNTHDNIPNI